MVVKLTEWDKKITGWTGIEVTANKVVNLLLRANNNLIKVDNNNYVYTDLQLEDWLATTDTLPVGVTTGRVLEADGWVKSGTMLCFKTTSWDYVTWIYWDDWKLYIDNWTGTFKQIYLKSEVDALFTQLRSELAAVAFSWDYSDLSNKPVLGTAASKDTWESSWNVPIIWENWKLPSSILPAMAMKAFTVATASDLTTLSDASTWDVAYVEDENKTYILVAEPYSTAANWQEYSAVNSVNWYRGVVNLTTNDIPVQWTTNQYASSNEKNTWNAKLAANDVATVALTGSYSDLKNKPAIPAWQIQSDWTQNNQSAVDYIKNKPTIDSSLSTSSQNAIQNWAVATAVNSINSDISTLQTAIGGATWDISTIEWQINTINWNITTINNNISSLSNTVNWLVSDSAYSSSWDWDTTHAPSKNAVYDVLWDINTLLANI